MQKINKVCYTCGTSWISEVESGSEVQNCNCLAPYDDLDLGLGAGFPTKQARNEACRQKLLQADTERLTALLGAFGVVGPDQLARLVLSAYREPHPA